MNTQSKNKLSSSQRNVFQGDGKHVQRPPNILFAKVNLRTTFFFLKWKIIIKFKFTAYPEKTVA